MSFNDFVHRNKLKYKATSNLKLYEVLKNIGLDSKQGVYLRDGPFSIDIGIVNLHPTEGTHLVCEIIENYVGSYGCVPPQELFKFFIKTKCILFIF